MPLARGFVGRVSTMATILLAIKRAERMGRPDRVTSETSTVPRTFEMSTPPAGPGRRDFEALHALSDIDQHFHPITRISTKR